MTPHRTSAPRRPAPRDSAQPAPPFNREAATEQLKKYLDLVARDMGMDLAYSIISPAGSDGGSNDIVVNFSGADEGLLLERNAELLLALEYVAHRWLRLDPRLHDAVRFDCGDYRATRLEELKLSARVAAQRVRETGQVFHFNPMSP